MSLSVITRCRSVWNTALNCRFLFPCFEKPVKFRFLSFRLVAVYLVSVRMWEDCVFAVVH